MKHLRLLTGLLALAAPLAAIATDSDPWEVALDGMEQIDKSRHGAIYADPGVDWSIYQQVRLDPATVAFRKNWLRDQNRYQTNRIRTQDVERIKNTMAETFDKVFREELGGEGGYTLTAENGEDVLRITPHIEDLDLYAPDPRSAPGIQRSYAESMGRMTLRLDFYDSVTGDLIATASENREAPRRGYLQWSNSVTNTKEARLMFQGWAKRLRERLDEARTVGLTED
ncbi:MAG: DUF3313 family protein [Xanthomonadales bacterium]